MSNRLSVQHAGIAGCIRVACNLLLGRYVVKCGERWIWHPLNFPQFLFILAFSSKSGVAWRLCGNGEAAVGWRGVYGVWWSDRCMTAVKGFEERGGEGRSEGPCGSHLRWHCSCLWLPAVVWWLCQV